MQSAAANSCASGVASPIIYSTAGAGVLAAAASVASNGSTDGTNFSPAVTCAGSIDPGISAAPTDQRRFTPERMAPLVPSSGYPSEAPSIESPSRTPPEIPSPGPAAGPARSLGNPLRRKPTRVPSRLSLAQGSVHNRDIGPSPSAPNTGQLATAALAAVVESVGGVSHHDLLLSPSPTLAAAYASRAMDRDRIWSLRPSASQLPASLLSPTTRAATHAQLALGDLLDSRCSLANVSCLTFS